jgi:hypothetical protein
MGLWGEVSFWFQCQVNRLRDQLGHLRCRMWLHGKPDRVPTDDPDAPWAYHCTRAGCYYSSQPYRK